MATCSPLLQLALFIYRPHAQNTHTEMNWCGTKLGVHTHSSKPQQQLNCCKNIKELNLKLPQGQILFLQPCSSENVSISRITVFVVLRKDGSGKGTLHRAGKIRRWRAGLEEQLFHSLYTEPFRGKYVLRFDYRLSDGFTATPLPGGRKETAGPSAAHSRAAQEGPRNLEAV